MMDKVDLNYQRDANKRLTKLSGGMDRRALLTLQLAQHKCVIVLDEPFTGLDSLGGVSVAKQLYRMKKIYNITLLLITHKPHLARIILGENANFANNNSVIELKPVINLTQSDCDDKPLTLDLFGTTFFQHLWIGYWIALDGVCHSSVSHS